MQFRSLIRTLNALIKRIIDLFVTHNQNDKPSHLQTLTTHFRDYLLCNFQTIHCANYRLFIVHFLDFLLRKL